VLADQVCKEACKAQVDKRTEDGETDIDYFQLPYPDEKAFFCNCAKHKNNGTDHKQRGTVSGAVPSSSPASTSSSTLSPDDLVEEEEEESAGKEKDGAGKKKDDDTKLGAGMIVAIIVSCSLGVVLAWICFSQCMKCAGSRNGARRSTTSYPADVELPMASTASKSNRRQGFQVRLNK